jgi:hypothetical protein
MNRVLKLQQRLGSETVRELEGVEGLEAICQADWSSF